MFGGYPNTSSSVPQSAQLTAPQINSKNLLEGQLLDAQRENIEAILDLRRKKVILQTQMLYLLKLVNGKLTKLTPAQLDNLDSQQ